MMYEIYEDLYEAYLEAKVAANEEEEEDEQSSPLFLTGSGPVRRRKRTGACMGAKKN